jgi:hypothetical protein
MPEQVRSRFAALGPGGSYAKQLAGHAVVTIVGDNVLSHAGVLPAWTARLDEVNDSARCWLDGQRAEPPASLAASDSPMWTRVYGGDHVDCGQLHTALDSLHAKRMIVAHTVQHEGITSACEGALWRIDVGMTQMIGGPIEVLELTAGVAPKVLRGHR